MKYILLFITSLLLLHPLSAKPTIIVSVAPSRFLVQKIAGDLFECPILVPVGSSPHFFEPSLRQIIDLTHAQIWFRSGENFEKRIIPVFEDKMAIVNLTDSLQNNALPSHCCHDIDLHIWLSPQLLCKQAHIIRSALTTHFPEHEALFSKNCAQLIGELNLLDQEIRSTLSSAVCRSFLTTHPAFGYFCREYGLEEISIEIEGKEASMKQIFALTKYAREKKVSTLIMPPQYSSKAGNSMAKSLNAKTVPLDPYFEDVPSTLRGLAGALSQ
jgi:zinc transport system substrate-binding protein